MRGASAAWFNAETMIDRYETARALGATALLASVFVLFVFVAPRDPSHVAAGATCSVLSENEIGRTVGAPVRLMPTGGGICEYVSTGAAGVYERERRLAMMLGRSTIARNK
jgi:hypothetical protein